MTKRTAIHCGDHVVGYVEKLTCDNFHNYGSFAPGPDFVRYKEAILAVRSLMREAKSNPEVDWIDALEIVNDYGFAVAKDDGTFTSIRDFKLDDNGVAEFKFDW